MLIGSLIIPDSNRFTFLTSIACDSIDMFLWITPMPPSWAMAIASLPSVTVSIAAEIIGVFKVILLVSFEVKLTSFGRTSECAGTNNISSKVSAFFKSFIVSPKI